MGHIISQPEEKQLGRVYGEADQNEKKKKTMIKEKKKITWRKVNCGWRIELLILKQELGIVISDED